MSEAAKDIEQLVEYGVELDKNADGDYVLNDDVKKKAATIVEWAVEKCTEMGIPFTKEPVKPGDTGVIDVTYNGTDKFPGRFQKTITIRSNAVSEVTRLIIEGDME